MINVETISRAALLDALSGNSTLVTVNRRLARSVLQEYETHMISQGRRAWQTPDILPCQAWLLRCWEQAVIEQNEPSSGMVLSVEQETAVWESIIRQYHDGLLRVTDTARQAREAWSLLMAWRLSINQPAFNNNEDTRAFRKWAAGFEKLCSSNGWLSESVLAKLLADSLSGRKRQGEGPLLWLGFDELRPDHETLLQALSDSGIEVRRLQYEQQPRQAVRVKCIDARSECSAIASWVRQCIDQNPRAGIGVVVPDLAAYREKLDQALTVALAPQLQYPAEPHGRAPWNISLGYPLAHFPIIRTAFCILRLTGKTAPVDDIAAVLSSPYIRGWNEESTSRALLDRRLRENGEAVVSIDLVRFFAMQHDTDATEPVPWTSPAMAKCIDALIEAFRGMPLSALPSQWIDFVSATLKQSGWTEGRSLDSIEYQAIESWKAMLSTFASLDAALGEIPFTRVLERLQLLAEGRVFQPEGGNQSIQVLGVYEATGLEFDHLWMAGLHDDAWPPAPRTNPFIPLALQVQHAMPNANHEIQLNHARLITKRLASAADDVVMSYPGMHQSEPLRVSPLIIGFTKVAIDSVVKNSHEAWIEIVRKSARREILDIENTMPLQPGRVFGGSGIFKSQSLCPFKAFAEYRLGAKPLRRLQSGLDAMKRGSLLHKALELFWRDVKNHEALLALDENARAQLVSDKVSLAVEELFKHRSLVMSGRFRSVEINRLERLMLEWLEIEARRAPFEVVALEKVVDVEIEGVQIHLYLDRIDRLNDGRIAIIDYKTGKVQPGDWFGARPDEPQLPLYSVIEDDEIASVLFAQIQSGELAYKGVVAESGLVPGLPPGRSVLKQATDEWPAVLDEWKKVIRNLAVDFRRGNAAVDPKSDNATCRNHYCELSHVCRLSEQHDNLGEIGAPVETPS